MWRAIRGRCRKPDPTSLAFQLYDVGTSLLQTDIDQGVELLRQATALTTAAPSVRVKVLVALGAAVKSRYSTTLHTDDIDESIRCYTKALALLPPDADRYLILAHLGQAYYGRCASVPGDLISARNAVEAHREALAALPRDHPAVAEAASMLESSVRLVAMLDRR